MRSILTIALKDLKLMRRDWMGLFFILAFPVIMGVFLGMITGSFDVSEASIAIAVVDEDDSTISAQFVTSLQDNKNVKVVPLVRDEAMDHVRRGKLVGLVAIPVGFGETAGIMWADGPVIQIGTDPSRQAVAAMLEGLVMKAMGDLVATRLQDPASLQPIIQQTQDDLANAEDVTPLRRIILSQMLSSLEGLTQSLATIQEEDAQQSETGGSAGGLPKTQIARVESIDVTREYAKGSAAALVRKVRSRWDIAFPQAMLWGVLGCAAGFAITIVRERTQGTMLRLQVAAITRTQVLAGKATACFLAVTCVIALLVAIGMALGMRPKSPELLVLATACIAFCFVGVMMLMSVVGKTEEAVSGAAWFGNIMMAMFGGAMIPLVFMPSYIKTLSHFSPVKWSILALEGAIWRGFTLTEMVMPCGILLGIGAFCLAFGVARLSRTTI